MHILEKLEKNLNTIKIDHLKINFTYFEGLINNIKKYAKNIHSIYSSDVIIIFELNKKTKVFGFSYCKDIDIKNIFEKFNGEGTNYFSSFTTSEKNIEKLIKDILEEISKKYTPILKAKDIMSSPVRTILSSEPIEKVHRIMIQTGHNGFPVIEKNELIGIITRKDIEKAINHGLSKVPVKEIITKNIISVLPDTPIEEIRYKMLENGIGRLLVIDKNNMLIGIITRSDLIKGKVFHKSKPSIIVEYKEELHKYNILKKMVKFIPPKYMNLLRLLGIYGSELNMPVYVVGGFVRDLLLERENFDIDIVVEGDGLKYAKYAAKNLRITFVEHSEFHTGSLFFKDGFRIDIATARTEYYEKPADLPKVELSTIKKDLYRRDFSINAMAIKLNSEEFGVLLDFFGCKRDLDNGIIRILYNLSFIEDPTRILRAIRFKKRFNFKIENRTLELLQDAVNNNYIEKVTGMRLREEFEKILNEKDIIKTVEEMGKLKILDHLFLYSKYSNEKVEKFSKILEFYNWVKINIPEYTYKTKIFHLFLYPYLIFEDKKAISYAFERYGLPKKFISNIEKMKNSLSLLNTLNSNSSYSDIYKLVESFDNELLITLSGYLKNNLIEKYKNYLLKIKNFKLEINGKDIIQLGIKGKLIGKILDEIKMKKLDDKIQNEKDYLLKIVRELNNESI
ncbi:tRNA nucleotidyltransferase (CCA-adding enzyme) [Marinitoga hydrogenitolerans DSM 16785]|uniref:tRNA nucleotidyltransferase (CCA-adding enzyme) n=1 Tax=Marinitoga hydrogenitolerans (strain DSM 16785 / JCM 12826 / AT1271) TaxID=1122195 RepID=A0A1M4SNC8_MARH1|nr:CBS domain-containing protein [Marinitoga hydrogenitolerans]SHE33730.1 tRNA nucleotidyltransferase (CCA-adding enzyme) [Marinitoga hydrogenitolerans DSM 16785]